MNIGLLDKRCRIERKSVTQNAEYGTEIIDWTLLGVCWCGVQDVLPSRTEAVKNGIALAANQTRVRMRYRSDVNSSMRLIINRPEPIIYQIVAGPAELGNKDGIEMIVERYSS